MEKQTLPNSTLILVLGILSLVTCCCYGIFGIILGIITLVLAKTATRNYVASPELYSGYGNVKTGKILAIISIILGLIYIITIIVAIVIYGMEGLQEMQTEMMRDYGGM